MDDTYDLYYFKTRMVEFMDALIEQFPHEPSFIIVRIFISDKIPIKDVLGKFMKECLPYEGLVKKRDADFFLYSDFIFQKYSDDVGTEELKHFRDIWKSEMLDDTDKEAIWKWLNMFIVLAHNYYDKYGCIEGWTFNLEEECNKFEEELKKN